MSSSNMKKFLIVAVIALIVYLLATQPQNSAAWIKALLAWLQHVANQIIVFFKNVFGA